MTPPPSAHLTCGDDGTAPQPYAAADDAWISHHITCSNDPVARARHSEERVPNHFYRFPSPGEIEQGKKGPPEHEVIQVRPFRRASCPFWPRVQLRRRCGRNAERDHHTGVGSSSNPVKKNAERLCQSWLKEFVSHTVGNMCKSSNSWFLQHSVIAWVWHQIVVRMRKHKFC